jgi:hypothetical protein
MGESFTGEHYLAEANRVLELAAIAGDANIRAEPLRAAMRFRQIASELEEWRREDSDAEDRSSVLDQINCR